MRQLTLSDETADRVILMLSTFAGIPDKLLFQVRKVWNDQIAGGQLTEDWRAEQKRIEEAAIEGLLEYAQATPDLTERMELCMACLNEDGIDQFSNDKA